jgi:ADP-ribose pyrophosphatase
MGTWEWRAEVDPRDLAAGELQEETGLRAGTLIEIGRVFQAAGYSDQAGRVFFATDLTQGAHALEHEEQDMVQGQFPLAEFERMIRDGVVQDVITITAFAMARLKGLI